MSAQLASFPIIAVQVGTTIRGEQASITVKGEQANSTVKGEQAGITVKGEQANTTVAGWLSLGKATRMAKLTAIVHCITICKC